MIWLTESRLHWTIWMIWTIETNHHSFSLRSAINHSSIKQRKTISQMVMLIFRGTDTHCPLWHTVGINGNLVTWSGLCMLRSRRHKCLCFQCLCEAAVAPISIPIPMFVSLVPYNIPLDCSSIVAVSGIELLVFWSDCAILRQYQYFESMSSTHHTIIRLTLLFDRKTTINQYIQNYPNYEHHHHKPHFTNYLSI